MPRSQEESTRLMDRFHDGQSQLTERLAAGAAAPSTENKLQSLEQQLYPCLEKLRPFAPTIGVRQSGDSAQFSADAERTT
ncbi:hypothetical protein E8E14_010579 [Neopestalotiopsis sp. 37M]|nr:hypothetical protein E8E14_010579 [Neopestalotiopsis sp. 37M]